MPIGFCPRCQARFVVEDARSYQRTCPHCLRPMTLLGAAALPAGTAGAGELPAAGPRRGNYLEADLPEVPRLMAVIAESAYQCEVARQRQAAAQAACRQARELIRMTGRLMGPDDPLPPVPDHEPPEAPDSRSDAECPVAEPCGPALRACAAQVRQRAVEARLGSKIVREVTRRTIEALRAAPGEVMLLPPLDYRLAPLAGGGAGGRGDAAVWSGAGAVGTRAAGHRDSVHLGVSPAPKPALPGGSRGYGGGSRVCGPVRLGRRPAGRLGPAARAARRGL